MRSYENPIEGFEFAGRYRSSEWQKHSTNWMPHALPAIITWA